MKAAGTVRRIDDLGRISLPKELRNIYDIKAGDSIEIWTEGDRIILSKYNNIEHPDDVVEEVITELQRYDDSYNISKAIHFLKTAVALIKEDTKTKC